MKRICFDCEMTGLHKDTSLISIGLVSDCGREFYAELIDYNRNQLNEWLEENVIANLMFNNYEPFVTEVGSVTFVKGTKYDVQEELLKWFNRFDKVELWSDCHHYDVVLLHDIFGGAFEMPEDIYYIPFDLCTVFKVLGIDPDISREAFIDTPIKGDKHHALYDAKVIQACLDKLYRNKDKYPFVL